MYEDDKDLCWIKNIVIEKSSFVSFNITPGILKATEALNRMYQYTITNNPDLHAFLTENCKHLLTPPVQSSPTTIPIDILVSPKATIDLPETFRQSIIKDFNTQSGVYSFIYNNESKNIGSTTEFKTRLKSYYKDYSNFKKDNTATQLTFFSNVKSVGGFTKISYNILYTAPNFK